MEKFNLYLAFVNELQDKFPQKSLLVNNLSDLLVLEKESIYRRLRGDVPFTIFEIGKIAKAYNISLDKLIFNGDTQNTLFQFNWVTYDDIDNPDYKSIIELIDYTKMVLKQPNPECGFSLNAFDLFSFPLHKELSTFLKLKKIYRKGNDRYIHFEDIQHKDHFNKLMKEFYLLLTKFNKITFIWDKNLISNLADDINYFVHIGLIKPENIELIKKDLLSYLTSIEKAAFASKFQRTDNIFELYIAEVNINQSCGYMGSSRQWLSILNTFDLQICSSTQQKSYQGLKNWIQSLKELSIQISGAGEKERIKFFKTQKSIVDSL